MESKLMPDEKEAIERLIKVREDIRYTQNQLADILNINLSTYKKIESYRRQISLTNLKALNKNLNVSTDYILYGEKTPQERVWAEVLNCSEADKVLLFLRMFQYFTENRPELYPEQNEAFPHLAEVVHLLTDGTDTTEGEKR